MRTRNLLNVSHHWPLWNTDQSKIIRIYWILMHLRQWCNLPPQIFKHVTRPQGRSKVDSNWPRRTLKMFLGAMQCHLGLMLLPRVLKMPNRPFFAEINPPPAQNITPQRHTKCDLFCSNALGNRAYIAREAPKIWHILTQWPRKVDMVLVQSMLHV